MAAGSASPFGPLMLNQTTFDFPFPPDGATKAALVLAVNADSPTCLLHAITPGVLPDPLALGMLPSGATVAMTLFWLDANEAQVGPSVSDTKTLPSGPDSPLGLTITTRPGPTPEPLPPPGTP